MNWRNRIVKGLKNLPAIRQPKVSEAEKLRRSHLWALQPRVKDVGLNIGTYFEAGDMPWVRVCRRVIKNRVISLGYQVTNPERIALPPSPSKRFESDLASPAFYGKARDIFGPLAVSQTR